MSALERLAEPMNGDGCRAEPMTDAHREQLRAACAEDGEIWQLWMLDFGPDGFDASFDRIAQLPWLRFILFEGDELAGMSCFINPDEARGTVEIGNTYYRPKFRGSGFNRRAKDMMLALATMPAHAQPKPAAPSPREFAASSSASTAATSAARRR